MSFLFREVQGFHVVLEVLSRKARRKHKGQGNNSKFAPDFVKNTKAQHHGRLRSLGSGSIAVSKLALLRSIEIIGSFSDTFGIRRYYWSHDAF